jgi:hypothetical protein
VVPYGISKVLRGKWFCPAKEREGKKKKLHIETFI